MTEKERREKGLPPSPAQVVLLETIKKDAEERSKAILEAVGPALPALTKSVESMRAITAPLAEIAKSMETVRETLVPKPFMFGIHDQPLRRVFPNERYLHEPRTVRLDPAQLEELKAARTTETSAPLYMDLLYDKKTKELYRLVHGRHFGSTFIDTEDNKRLNLFEKVMRKKKAVPTKELAEYLGCSQKQVQNLVQAINAKVEKDLHVSEPLIKANRGSGYYINKFYCVVPSE